MTKSFLNLITTLLTNYVELNSKSKCYTFKPPERFFFNSIKFYWICNKDTEDKEENTLSEGKVLSKYPEAARNNCFFFITEASFYSDFFYIIHVTQKPSELNSKLKPVFVNEEHVTIIPHI